MSSIRPRRVITPRYAYRAMLFLFVVAVLFTAHALAQQPAGKKKAPRLTTDDLVSEKVASSDGSEESTGEAETGGHAKPADAKASPDELAWRERVLAARGRVTAAEKEADESELRVTELRNHLGDPGQTPGERNEIAAELDREGDRLSQLRDQERTAKRELEALLEEGREKGFAEKEKTTGETKHDEDYYRTRYRTLLEALQTAERRMNLHENRLRDLNHRITQNSGTGDNFFIGQLQQQRDEAQQNLEEARSARAEAQQTIEALMEEARRAGIPPGVFRN